MRVLSLMAVLGLVMFTHFGCKQREAHAASVGKLASAGAESPGEVAYSVRCQGTRNGHSAGLDFEFDELGRAMSVVDFEQDSTNIVNFGHHPPVNQYIQVDNSGQLQILVFRSFNDGLEATYQAVWVKGKPELTVLYSAGSSSVGALGPVSNVTCKLVQV